MAKKNWLGVLIIVSVILVIGCNASKITEKNLVGIWELENTENISRRELSGNDEFFKDGTGISSQGSKSISFKWQIRDGNRLQFEASGHTEISVIELSENGKLLTYIYDNNRKAMYRKK
ncbi:MAG: hypothetical protein FWB77_03770 [Treponema sp.]|nr:hypothetical protein [Treponema sp.]